MYRRTLLTLLGMPENGGLRTSHLFILFIFRSPKRGQWIVGHMVMMMNSLIATLVMAYLIVDAGLMSAADTSITIVLSYMFEALTFIILGLFVVQFASICIGNYMVYVCVIACKWNAGSHASADSVCLFIGSAVIAGVGESLYSCTFGVLRLRC